MYFLATILEAPRRQVGRGGRHFVLLGHPTRGTKVAGGAGRSSLCTSWPPYQRHQGGWWGGAVVTLYFLATLPEAPRRQVGRGGRHFILSGHHTGGTKAAGGVGRSSLCTSWPPYERHQVRRGGRHFVLLGHRTRGTR